MTDAPNNDAPQTQTSSAEAPAEIVPITDATELETRLNAVRETLARQLEFLDREDYDAFDGSCRNLAPVLQAVTSAQCQVTHEAFETIREIQKLHRQVGLKLADHSAAAAKALDRVRAGKNIVKAYKS